MLYHRLGLKKYLQLATGQLGSQILPIAVDVIELGLLEPRYWLKP